LPPETADKNYSGKIALKIPSNMHKKIVITAHQNGESVNKFIERQLKDKLRLN
jgi:predicted HicB family RNase H-like nuclease